MGSKDSGGGRQTISDIIRGMQYAVNTAQDMLQRHQVEQLERYFNAEATEKQAMRFIKIATSIWGILGTLIALGFTAAYNALDAWWILAGIFSGGMLGLFLLGLVFKEKSNSSAAAIAVILGISLIAYLTLSPYCSFLPDLGFSPLLIPVFGTSLIFVSGFILTKFFCSKL